MVRKVAKVVIWGIKEDYESVYNSIELEKLKGNIEIVAFCCRKSDISQDSFDGCPLVSSDKLLSLDFDFIIVANKISFRSIQKEAFEIVKKHSNKKIMILTSEIFKIPRFDFYQSITSNSNLLSRKDLINSNFNLNVFDYERIKRHEFRYHPYHKIIAEKINFLDDDGELIKSLIRGGYQTIAKKQY